MTQATISSISFNRSYSSAGPPFTGTVSYTAGKMSGYLQLSEDTVAEVMGVLAEALNKEFAPAGEELAKIQIPALIAPSTPEGSYTEVETSDDVPL
jgi:hypothetical protein